MKMKQTKTQKRVQLVLERLVAFSNDDSHSSQALAEALDDMLDDLCMDDFFGTETQMDPRGDGRDGSWTTIKRVQGVDK